MAATDRESGILDRERKPPQPSRAANPDANLPIKIPAGESIAVRLGAGVGDDASVTEGGGGAEGKRHLRGSSLLLAGRVISLGLNFGISVLLVRALAKAEFGAFSYALAMGSLGTVLAAGGLDQALARFVPIYQERGNYSRMLGAILLAAGAILGAGLGLTLVVWVAHDTLTGRWINDPLAASLLAILVLLAPLQAIDRLLAQLVAIFARPRAVFWRKHVVGPTLKLSAVLVMIQFQSDAYFLAGAYLAASAIGTMLYLYILVVVCREQQLWSRMRSARLTLPARELFSYSIPLLSSDFVFVLRTSFAVFLLEYLHSSTSVAEFRAVLPVARLNNVVAESFLLLFLPLASRMFARGDHVSVHGMYWSTATWIAVLTFPIFAATFVLSRPIAVLLFGAEYSGSGNVLAVLAVGSYFHAALGFNAAMLRVYNKVKWIVAIDACVAVLAFPMGWLLIDRFGAMGAAWAVTLTHLVNNLLNQAALMRVGGGSGIPFAYLRAGLTIISAIAGMMAMQSFLEPPLIVMVVLVAAGSGAVLWLNRDSLDLGGTFPELRRVPLLRRLCTGGAP